MRTDRAGAVFRLLWAVEVAMLLCVMLGWTVPVSPLFALTFVLLVLWWLAEAAENIHPLTLWAVGAAVLALIHVLLNALTAGVAVTLPLLRKWAMFAASSVCLLLGATGSAGRELRHFILQGNTPLAVGAAAGLLLRGEEAFLINGALSPYLTLGFSNPNTAGMFLAAVCGLELVSLRGSTVLWRRLLHLVLAAAAVCLTVASGSRTALLSLAVEIAFFLRSLFPVWSAPGRRFCGVLAALPLIFAGIYLMATGLTLTADLPAAFPGKPGNSRRGIWLQALEWIGRAPMLGSYSRLGGSFQMHNSLLDILVSYGAAVTVLLWDFLRRLLLLRRDTEGDPTRFAALGGFCAMLVLGVGEAALFSGGLGVHLFAGAFLLLAGTDLQKEGGQG